MVQDDFPLKGDGALSWVILDSNRFEIQTFPSRQIDARHMLLSCSFSLQVLMRRTIRCVIIYSMRYALTDVHCEPLPAFLSTSSNAYTSVTWTEQKCLSVWSDEDIQTEGEAGDQSVRIQ